MSSPNMLNIILIVYIFIDLYVLNMFFLIYSCFIWVWLSKVTPLNFIDCCIRLSKCNHSVNYKL